MAHRNKPFRYKPLDPTKDEIRLLTLLPAATRDDRIQGSICVACLSNNALPAYNALSYMWGDPRKDHKIWIDNREFLVGRNLYQALGDIKPRQNALVVWIDAICIDQSNDEERGHQVQLMKRIYSNATLVRAWLDEEVDMSLAPFRALEEHGDDLDLNIGDAEFWEPMTRIFRNPYWSRLWVQQEMLLAAQLIFQFRRTTVEDKRILPFLSVVQDRQTNLLLGQRGKASHLIADMFGNEDDQHWGPDFMMRLASKDRQGDHFGLFNLYMRTHTLESSDLRDQLYGIIGISNDTRPDDVKVDYNLDPIELLAQIPSSCISLYYSLDFLIVRKAVDDSLLQDRKKRLFEKAPTWFPIPGQIIRFPRCASSSRGACGSIGPVRASVQIDRFGGVLLCARGTRIDMLSKVGQHTSITKAPFREWLQDLQDMTHSATNGNEASFWNSSILNTHFAAISYENEATGDVTCTLRSCHDFLSRTTQRTGKADVSLSDFLWVPEIRVMVKNKEFRTAFLIWDTFKDCQFLLTRKHGVGLARSCELQVGDEIWVLFGCQVPLILRKREPSGYTLVTQCWLEGVMDAEAVAGIFEVGTPSNRYAGPPIEDIVLW